MPRNVDFKDLADCAIPCAVISIVAATISFLASTGIDLPTHRGAAPHLAVWIASLIVGAFFGISLAMQKKSLDSHWMIIGFYGLVIGCAFGALRMVWSAEGESMLTGFSLWAWLVWGIVLMVLLLAILVEAVKFGTPARDANETGKPDKKELPQKEPSVPRRSRAKQLAIASVVAVVAHVFFTNAFMAGEQSLELKRGPESGLVVAQHRISHWFGLVDEPVRTMNDVDDVLSWSDHVAVIHRPAEGDKTEWQLRSETTDPSCLQAQIRGKFDRVADIGAGEVVAKEAKGISITRIAVLCVSLAVFGWFAVDRI